MVSVFQRINESAERRKAAKKAAYVPLPREVWRDDRPETITIASAGSGTRSTINGETYFTITTFARPTEIFALLAASGMWTYADESPLIDLPQNVRREKYCGWCELRLPLTEFSPRKDASDGRHSYCKSCRARLKRQRWKRF